MHIYLASSWRNTYHTHILNLLRENGFSVYNFRDEEGFSWRDVDADWENRTLEQYRKMLEHKRAIEGFSRDFDEMLKADAFVLLLPCGRSAHLEAGWAIGNHVPTFIHIPEKIEPELMYRMAMLSGGNVTITEEELLNGLEKV